MKKVLLLSLALTLVLGVSAQRIGVKLGANVAGMYSTTPVDGSKALTGLHAGLVVEKKIIALLSVRSNIMFSQKGYSVDDTYTTVGVEVNNKYKALLNYGTVDLQAKLKLGPGYVVAGPYFGYAINGSTAGETTVAGVATSFDNDMFDEDALIQTMNKTDFGLNVGLGAEFGLGPLHAFGELSYGHGLSNLYHDDFTKVFPDEKATNFVVGVSLGILLF